MPVYQIPEDLLKKTTHGLVTLRCLASNFRYERRGSLPIYGDRHRLFVSMEGKGFARSFIGNLALTAECNGNSILRWSDSPSPNYSNYFNPPSSERLQTAIQIVEWAKYGAALVLAKNPSHRRDVWLAFVPADEVRALAVCGMPQPKVIEPENPEQYPSMR